MKTSFIAFLFLTAGCAFAQLAPVGPASPVTVAANGKLNSNYTGGSGFIAQPGQVYDFSQATVTLPPTSTTGVSSVAGTINEVLVNGGTAAQTGDVTLTTPQAIGTGSSPVFFSVQTTNSALLANQLEINQSNFGSNHWVNLNTAQTSQAEALQITVGTTGAPVIAAFINTVGLTSLNDGLAVTGAVSGSGFSNYLASPPAIGGTTPAAGSFTTLSATSTISGAGITNLFSSPPPIGNTSANSGAFTTLAASGGISGAGFSSFLASPPIGIGSGTPTTGAFTTLVASNLTATSEGSIMTGEGNYGASGTDGAAIQGLGSTYDFRLIRASGNVELMHFSHLSSTANFDGPVNSAGGYLTAIGATSTFGGTVTIAALTGGNSLVVNGSGSTGGNYSALIGGSGTTGQSNGLDVTAGTNTSDYCQRWYSSSGNPLVFIRGDGFLDALQGAEFDSTFTISLGQINIGVFNTPASSSASGTQGTVEFDANFVYVCTATNTWKRSALSTW